MIKDANVARVKPHPAWQRTLTLTKSALCRLDSPLVITGGWQRPAFRLQTGVEVPHLKRATRDVRSECLKLPQTLAATWNGVNPASLAIWFSSCRVETEMPSDFPLFISIHQSIISPRTLPIFLPLEKFWFPTPMPGTLTAPENRKSLQRVSARKTRQ